MCGIVGVEGREASEVLVESLERLDYRGYDSAGIAVGGSGIEVRKGEGEIRDLVEDNDWVGLEGETGIGHTRWATHGEPSRANAHPHTDCGGEAAVVHNGIVENYSSLRRGLQERGHDFQSETDTEVIPHLFEEAEGSPEKRLREVISELEGSFAVCVLTEGRVLGARSGSPLVVGVGETANYLASDVPAIRPYTDEVVHLDDGQIAVLEDGRIEITDFEGEEVGWETERVKWDAEAAEKGGYDHFMMKEIREQPRALTECIGGRLDEMGGEVDLDIGIDGELLSEIDGIELVACGTSYHAAVYGARAIQEATGIPTGAEYASEYRYSPGKEGSFLTVGITQSGETADTLRALEAASAGGNEVLAVTNVIGSSVTQLSDETLYIRSGPEIGVAATKTFTSQVLTLAMLSLYLGRAAGEVRLSEAKELIAEMKEIPQKVQDVLDRSGYLEELAEEYVGSEAFFFVGRGYGYPVALEGALKMKEISYLHAEGFPAGELKHGPLALVTEETPVIASLTGRDSRTYEKTLSNAIETEARGADVVALADEGDDEIEKSVQEVVRLPETDERLSPVIESVPLQLLSYHVADELGRPIDKPRNLAKSVTVE